MSNSDPDRLERIEAILERLAQKAEQSDQRLDSNARAIEALSANAAEYQQARERLYQLMADLAQAQADTKREMYQLMSRQDQQFRVLSRRQGEIVEILKRLNQQTD